MKRRDFIRCSGLYCGSVAVGSLLGISILESCGTSMQLIKTQSTENKVSLDIGKFEDLQFKLVRVRGYDFDIGVQKQSEQVYKVLLMLCPHANQPVTKSGSSFVCPMHGSRFDSDGQVLKGPSSRPMPKLDYTIDKSNIIIELLNI